jgi:hypothetical protein
MPSDPHVPTTHPIPIAAEPHVARLRGNADDFYLRGRGSYTDIHPRCRSATEPLTTQPPTRVAEPRVASNAM